MTDLLIADDHPIILSGLEAVLRDTDYRIVATASDGWSAIAAAEEKKADILILDVSMPPPDGIEVARRLREAGDVRPIVLLTADLSDQRLLDAVDLGVEGIVLKEGAPAKLLACLDSVRSGGRWVEQDLLHRALDLKMHGPRTGAGRFDTLSRRERAVADLVADGLRNREIADSLAITEGTVKVHLHRIYEKLSVSSRTELALLVRSVDPS